MIGSMPAPRNISSAPGFEPRAMPTTVCCFARSRAIGNATRPVAPVTNTRHRSVIGRVAVLLDDVVGGIGFARALPELEQRERPVLRHLPARVLVPAVDVGHAPRHLAVACVDARGVL